MSHCAKIVFLQNLGDVKNEAFEKKLHFLFLSFLCWRNRNRKKKKKWKRPKNAIKIGFLRWSCKNVKNKKMDFFLQKLPDTICVRKGKTRIFVHTICLAKKLFWPKTV